MEMNLLLGSFERGKNRVDIIADSITWNNCNWQDGDISIAVYDSNSNKYLGGTDEYYNPGMGRDVLDSVVDNVLRGLYDNFSDEDESLYDDFEDKKDDTEIIDYYKIKVEETIAHIKIHLNEISVSQLKHQLSFFEKLSSLKKEGIDVIKTKDYYITTICDLSKSFLGAFKTENELGYWTDLIDNHLDCLCI